MMEDDDSVLRLTDQFTLINLKSIVSQNGMAPALANHNSLVDNICESLINMQISDVEKQRLDSEVSHFFREHMQTKKNVTGDQRMEQIIHLINNIPGYELSYFQKMFMDEILKCMSPIIFGNPPAHELANLLKKYGQEPPKTRMMFGGTSRRGGKTDTLTLAAAALLACCPNVSILFFSIYIPTCEVACRTVYAWLKDWGFVVNQQVKKTKMTITFYNPQDITDVRTLIFISGQNKDVRKKIYLYLFFMYLFLYIFSCLPPSSFNKFLLFFSKKKNFNIYILLNLELFFKKKNLFLREREKWAQANQKHWKKKNTFH